jgi:aspartate/glutamate racemase
MATSTARSSRVVAIKAVKAGDLGPAVRKRVRDAAAALIRRGADAIVLGCTELPLVMGPQDAPVPVLDGTDLLAAATVREALPEEFSLRQRRSYPRALSAKHHAGVSVPARRR